MRGVLLRASFLHSFTMEKRMNIVNLRGVNFTPGTLEEISNEILTRIKSEKQTAVFTPNSEIVQLCIDDATLYDVINSAEIIVPDGIGIVKAAKLLGLPITERVPGIELGERILSLADDSLPIFLLGGKPGIAESAAKNLTAKYPSLVICGTHDGYFKKEGTENNAVIEEINESHAKVLFVCLGAPTQEKWIRDNRKSLSDVQLLLGLGGSLDVFSGNVKRAPAFFCKTGLEWLYRLIKEPRRIGRMMKLPKFYFGTLLYKLKGGK